MVVRRVLFVMSMAFAVVAVSPAMASGAATGVTRPLIGRAAGTTTVNLVSGAGTTVNTGHLSQLGAFTGNFNTVYTLTGPTTFTSTGAGALVAASGDKVFAMTAATGTLSGTAVTATTIDTITGGTGRFAGASGTITVTATGTSASTVGSVETFSTSGTWKGSITY